VQDSYAELKQVVFQMEGLPFSCYILTKY
jgi:hypothetical protein